MTLFFFAEYTKLVKGGVKDIAKLLSHLAAHFNIAIKHFFGYVLRGHASRNLAKVLYCNRLFISPTCRLDYCL